MERNIWIEGISLRCRRVGEIHKAVVLLDRRGGIREATLHGAYKGRGRLSASTEPFKHLKLLLYHNPVKDSWKILDGELLGGFAGLGKEVFRIYLASLWAELLVKTQGGGAVENEGEELFLLFGRSLGALSTAPPPYAPAVNVQFLWRFLKFMGYEADRRICGSCGSTLDGGAVYDSGGHRFLCPRCTPPRQRGTARGGVKVSGTYLQPPPRRGRQGSPLRRTAPTAGGDSAFLFTIRGKPFSKNPPVQKFPIAEGIPTQMSEEFFDNSLCHKDLPIVVKNTPGALPKITEFWKSLGYQNTQKALTNRFLKEPQRKWVMAEIGTDFVEPA